MKSENRDRVFLIYGTSTAAGTRLAYSPDALSNTGGFAIWLDAPVAVHLPAGEEIFAIDAIADYLTYAEIVGPYTNAIRLY